MNEEENSEEENIEKLKRLLYTNTLTQYGKRMLISYYEKQIKKYEEHIEKLQKENKELRQERELVGLPVRNKRNGTIGIILHQWESGSIAVLENIKPRVINTHDNWNTLEIINDNVEQKRTENNCIPIQKVKDKIEELKNNKENYIFERLTSEDIKRTIITNLQELLEK